MRQSDYVPIVHGHWIVEGSGYCGDYAECSECGEIIEFSPRQKMNYCPNCGAKMDEEAEHDIR